MDSQYWFLGYVYRLELEFQKDNKKISSLHCPVNIFIKTEEKSIITTSILTLYFVISMTIREAGEGKVELCLQIEAREATGQLNY